MKKIKLGDIGKVCMCKRILKHQTSPHGEIPFYKISTFGGIPDCFISRETFEEYKKKFSYPKKGDILISAAGTIGKVVHYDGEEAFFQDSNIVWIDNDESQIINDYLYYLFLLKPWKKTTGSIIARLYNDDIRNIEIEVPPLETQKKIAAVLSALDDKITLNKKINATLEAMAKTLYDYWFVQFDFPDENGKPYKTSGGKMIYSSELGRDIPAGWTVVTLGDLMTENATPFYRQTTEPTIDLSVMPSASIALDKLNNSDMFTTNLFKMTEGDILFGNIRPYLKKAGIAPCEGVVVGTVHSYRSKKDCDYTFVLFTVCRDKFFDYAVKVSTGTRMPVIKSEDLLAYKVAYSENIAKLFDMPGLKRIICKNVQESCRLAELRDWLLPMMMNGQIKF